MLREEVVRGFQQVPASEGCVVNEARIREVVDSLSAREAERLGELLTKRMKTCIIDGTDGAFAYKVTRGGISASILLCPACFERHRLPEGRSEVASE